MLLQIVAAGLVLGALFCSIDASGRFGNEGRDVDNDKGGKSGIWEEVSWWLGPGTSGRPGPRPRPHRPPFFTGVFVSDPAREVQINMYKVFQCLGLSPDYVSETIRVNISQQGRSNYSFSESVGNTTLFNFTFTLDSQSTTDFLGADADVMVRTRGRNELVMNYNGTSAGDIQVVFRYGDHNRGFDAIFRCPQNSTSLDLDRPTPRDNLTTGVRHFTKARRDERSVEEADETDADE